MDKKTKINVVYIFLAIMGVLVFRDIWLAQQHVEALPYSEFEKALAAGKIAEVAIGTTEITGAFKEPAEGEKTHFVTERVEPNVAERLAKYDVKFYAKPESMLKGLLGWIMPIVVFFGLWLLVVRPMMERQTGGMMAIGKSRAKIYVEKDTKVTFADVAGVDEAKEELSEVIGFLKDPTKYGRLGARVPKGVLLVGPPGTGKTLLAKAIAGEAGVPFFSISGSEFVELFVGVGAARVRDLFEQARKHAPCIIFIDELDALGRARGSFNFGGGHDEKEQTLNQLLAELDGFDASSGIVLLAATNRPEILDPALLRAGRFDRQILVDRPDRRGRIQILNVHLKKINVAPGVSVEEIAALTPGFTGADLANLVNEAALLATRRNATAVTFEDFTQAIERIIAGLEKKNRLLNPHEREIVAHHEIGHALVAMALPGCDPIQKVSIIPRGIGALGYTIQRPLADRFLMDRSELVNRMTTLLGGRAAETLIFPEVSTGAVDDLNKVTDIARSMVVRFGMVPELGQVTYEPEQNSFLGAPSGSWQPRRYGEGTADAIDAAVKTLVDQAFQHAVDILTRNRALLEKSAKRLLEKETLAGDELQSVMAEVKGDPAAPVNALVVAS